MSQIECPVIGQNPEPPAGSLLPAENCSLWHAQVASADLCMMAFRFCTCTAHVLWPLSVPDS